MQRPDTGHAKRPSRPSRMLAGAFAVACLLGGCAGSTGGSHSATLMLDFTPNAVHAGIYAALHEGYDRAAGVRLQVEEPAASTDSIKLLAAGRVGFAILDIHDLAIADAQGQPLVAVMAIVQEPLAALIAQPWITSPRDLEGRTVGITGDPSDEAVLDSIVSGSGGDPRRIRRVNIGFQAVPSLLANRVAATTSFWNDEGVELAKARPGTREFRVNRFGAPSYPELVLCVTRAELDTRRQLVQRVTGAIERGYQLTLREPRRAAADMLSEVPDLDRATLTTQLAALHGAFIGSRPHYGELNIPTLREWAAWEARFGIVSRLPDVSAMFDTGFAP
ncbi:MAG: ABC transporter substrate-binding protein [Acidobacteriota bacterium]|nr:ABC transporter substrate-binding protein [Acidobacteriota bacterium]